jgi:hypothetical protein
VVVKVFPKRSPALMELLVSLNVRETENSAGWTTYGTFLVVVLDQFAIACTEMRRDLRYGTGSVSDLSIDHKVS